MTETITEQISDKINNIVTIIELLERKQTLNKLTELCGTNLSAEIAEYKQKEQQKIMEELEKLTN